MPGENSSSIGPGEIACPDPSVHAHQHKLSEQASTAALYVTHPERQTEYLRELRENPLGPDGKLSSKSAATSLKYARAQDLPSFPINGLAADSAGKAAALAKDYKMKQLWQPEASAAGSKAAFVAAGKGGKVDLWQPSPSANSNSAATLAMRNKTLSPKVDYGYTDDGKSKALLAATMSHSRGRARATSTPVVPAPAYPDSRNAVANALNAATLSHRASVKTTDGWDSEANQAARIQNLGNHMDKAMFGERPPVEPEVEEARHNAALRASAVSMAKQMYDYQAQKDANAAASAVGLASGSAGAEAAARNVPTTQQPDLKQEAMRYIHLQDAAHKLAAERLAKVDKSMEAERYREYYGYGNEGKSRRISQRLSLRGRKRASSEGTADLSDSDDEEQARRIRSQMSRLHSGVNTIDSRKQQDDRARLLAAAEKRVSARMQDMDSRVFAETGKVSPAMMEEWEAKARKRAQEERELQAANPGKTHIGGGKFMAQSEIEAIAAARLKPTLDEINDTAEKRRARDEELRVEKEEQERMRREEKVKNKEYKDDERRFKDELKARKDEQKAQLKREKEEEKTRKNEEKRLAKEEKRKSRDVNTAGVVAGGVALGEVADNVKEDTEAPAAAEAVQKHRSALSRLRDRFRKDHDDDDELADERPNTSHSGKATVAGVAGGAATGVAVDDLADAHHPAETTEPITQPPTEPSGIQASPAGVLATPASTGEIATDAAPSDVTGLEQHRGGELNTTPHEHEHDVSVAAAAGTTTAVTTVPAVSVPVIVQDVSTDQSVETLPPVDTTRPAFEQQPSLSGYYNDAVPQAVSTQKPDLERHISLIPERDEDLYGDSDDDDEEHIDQATERVLLERRITRERNQDFTGGGVREDIADPSPVETRGEEILKPTTVIAPTQVTTSEPVATPGEKSDTTLGLLGIGATDVASLRGFKSKERIDDLVHEPKEKGGHSTGAAEPVGTTSTEIGKPLSTNAQPTVREPVHPADAAVATKVKSNESNKTLTSREYRAGSTTAPGVDTPATAYIRKTGSVDLDRTTGKGKKAGGLATVDTSSSRKTSEEAKSKSSDKDRQGIRGFISRVTHRRSKSENKLQDDHAVSYDMHTAAHKPESSDTTGYAARHTEDTIVSPIDTTQQASSSVVKDEADSPSSFRRGETDPVDADDLSSSGADEDDVARGRGRGGLARKLGFGGKDSRNVLHKDPPPEIIAAQEHAAVARSGVDRTASYVTDDNEQYEEARDHFDESLAPPPAFAGQRKSESPARGTKFQEEL